MLLGSKKPTGILKSILRLYSSFSSEIVSVLLGYLLKTLSSSEFKKNADDASFGLSVESVLADWKIVILKLYNKEPELLLNLLKEILDMIEAQEDMKCEEGRWKLFSSTTSLFIMYSFLLRFIISLIILGCFEIYFLCAFVM